MPTATATTVAEVITEPGVYDLSVDEYHGDPVPGGSLSQSGAKHLLPPSCPALFRYAVDHPQPPNRAFDFGHAAHRLVLGAGPELVAVDAADWRTKAAREQRDAAYAEGLTPLLTSEYETVLEMAAALRAHPVASALFAPGSGRPEQALFWRDGIHESVMCRALLDWLPNAQPGRRIILPDYKTTRCADPKQLQRAIEDYGYHQQAAWYLDGGRALGLAADAAFVFVCQEKTPPYLVTVAEPDTTALRIGQMLNRRALDVYAECVASGEWPGYSNRVELVSLPPYVENRFLEDIAS